MNPLVQDLIKQYDMLPHPEGGYFRETMKSEEHIKPEGRMERPLFTSILFLLHENEVSHFHSLLSDEVWYHHFGESLNIVCIDQFGSFNIIELGTQDGQVLQACVKTGTIFASYCPSGGISMVGCMVSPGFLYEEFKLYSKSELLERFPQHGEFIEKLAL